MGNEKYPRHHAEGMNALLADLSQGLKGVLIPKMHTSNTIISLRSEPELKGPLQPSSRAWYLREYHHRPEVLKNRDLKRGSLTTFMFRPAFKEAHREPNT